tara:strand:- start:1026 stop:1571 length:546 start_codon:yes stop_codon:yes gene_type:complete
MSDDNTKNNFVVDEDLNHEELQDLVALKRVKDAISKKKRQIKDKNWLDNHPDLQEIVNSHRARRVKTKKPEKEGDKIQLELQPERKVDADLGKPITKTEIDYDKLAEKLSEKMKTKKPKPKPPKEDDYETEDSEDEPEPKPEAKATIKPKPEPTPTDRFNDTIAKAPPKIKHTIARGGKFF